jgi:hypothetical protein
VDEQQPQLTHAKNESNAYIFGVRVSFVDMGSKPGLQRLDRSGFALQACFQVNRKPGFNRFDAHPHIRVRLTRSYVLFYNPVHDSIFMRLVSCCT